MCPSIEYNIFLNDYCEQSAIDMYYNRLDMAKKKIILHIKKKSA